MPFDKQDQVGHNAPMEKKAIHTEAGPLQGAPYSPAVRVGPFLFISGQIPLDPATSRVVEGDFETQVRQCLRNLASILKQEGLGLDNIVKTTIFLKNLNDFSVLNSVYGLISPVSSRRAPPSKLPACRSMC